MKKDRSEYLKKQREKSKQKRKRKQQLLKEEIKKVQPPRLLRFVVGFLTSKFGGIPCVIFIGVIFEPIIESEFGSILIPILGAALWIFLGFTLSRWFNNKYEHYVELKRKLRSVRGF